MTTGSAARPFWLVAIGGLAGTLAGVGWTMLYLAAFRSVDHDNFRWPLPFPLDVGATLAVVALTWAPWIPLFVRAELRWWYAVIAGVVPLVGISLAGVTGVRLTERVGRRPAGDVPRPTADPA